MSRHRNIRTKNYDDYDDVDEYGKSYNDEEIGVSPGTVSQFMYRRDDPGKSVQRQPTLPEEDPVEDDLMMDDIEERADETSAVVDLDRMKLCIDYIENCSGDAFTREQVKRAVLAASYNAERALQLLLDHQGNLPVVSVTAKAPVPFLAKKLESLSVTGNAASTSRPDGGVGSSEPERKSQKISDVGVIRKVATFEDPTISTRDVVKKLKLPSVELPDWALSFVQEANQQYGAMAKTLQATHTGVGVNPPSAASFAVSGGDKRAFPRPESTPNLRLLDPGRSQPGTPTPGSPKGTRRGASKPFSSRATSRADESQGDTATLSTSKTPEVPSRSLIKITALYEQRQSSSKPLINLIVIGHVDAGKSTLMGHLLYKLGRVDAKQMAKFEHEANKIGKSSFKYAWVLDETGEERSRGITIDVAQTSFETTNKCINLMDAPGHKDFIPNMITGTAQADVAVLVVDATRGEFETGFQSGGQTREHTLLARSLGVAQLVVAVNKMDTVNWSQERFDQIVQMLAPFFKAVGFKDADVDFVPCSGFTGDNLTESPRTVEAAHWWTGPTLVERIDQFRPPVRQIDKPFRQIITDVFKSQAGGFFGGGKN
ncbi:HBS1-like protein [Hypsibius exemplaris]|uniref:HBS1-like protein n=1 Tax=Hypsibius exemplaris TaxID=2072580 RepID=A0A1W0WYI7_HYPEX|nr:HBS1-like protein [Hypsibius exemplaris]